MNRRHALAKLAGGAALVTASLSPQLAIAGGGGEKKKGGGATYVQFPMITTTVFSSNGRRGILTVELGVDGVKPPVTEAIQKWTPRLRDAYISTIARYAGTLRPGSLPDTDYLAGQLQRTTDDTLGQKGTKLLLGTVMLY